MFCEKKKSQKRGKIKLFYKIKNKIKIPVFRAFQNLLKDRVAFCQTLDNLPPEITIAISKIKKKKNQTISIINKKALYITNKNNHARL